MKGSTGGHHSISLWWLVQIVVHSGKGAGTQAHTSHEPQALRGLAQGKHQGGLLWQVLRFCGEERKYHFRMDVLQRCMGLAPTVSYTRDLSAPHLHAANSAKGQHAVLRKKLLTTQKAACATVLPLHRLTHPHIPTHPDALPGTTELQEPLKSGTAQGHVSAPLWCQMLSQSKKKAVLPSCYH